MLEKGCYSLILERLLAVVLPGYSPFSLAKFLSEDGVLSVDISIGIANAIQTMIFKRKGCY